MNILALELGPVNQKTITAPCDPFDSVTRKYRFSNIATDTGCFTAVSPVALLGRLLTFVSRSSRYVKIFYTHFVTTY